MKEQVAFVAEYVNNFVRDNEIEDKEMFLVLLIEALTQELRKL